MLQELGCAQVAAVGVRQQPGHEVADAGPARVGAGKRDQAVRVGAAEDGGVHGFRCFAGHPAADPAQPWHSAFGGQRPGDPAGDESVHYAADVDGQAADGRADYDFAERRQVAGVGVGPALPRSPAELSGCRCARRVNGPRFGCQEGGQWRCWRRSLQVRRSCPYGSSAGGALLGGRGHPEADHPGARGEACEAELHDHAQARGL